MTRAILEADWIIIKGSVDGLIMANVVDLAASTQISGNIFCGTLSVAKGARVNAMIERKS